MHHVRMLDMVYRQADDFDLIHFHINYLHFPLAARYMVPSLTTLHGRLDIPDLIPLFQQFRNLNFVSISNAQRKPLSWMSWRGTVHHGLPTGLYTFQEKPGSYLAFLGRISPEKRVDRAVEIARRTGMKLKIAAKVDAVDRDYFESKIQPLLKNPFVEFVGEIGEAEKSEFLGNALALLFPIDSVRAFRSSDDRSYGMRYPDYCVQKWICSGSAGGQKDRIYCRYSPGCRESSEEHFAFKPAPMPRGV